jgi:hypothetical protein
VRIEKAERELEEFKQQQQQQHEYNRLFALVMRFSSLGD